MRPGVGRSPPAEFPGAAHVNPFHLGELIGNIAHTPMLDELAASHRLMSQDVKRIRFPVAWATAKSAGTLV
jgi:hypothetical protein